MYEVQTYFYLSGWENCWTEGRDSHPWYFKTRREAQEAIDEFLEDVRQAVADGDMEEEYDPDDLRIVEVSDEKVQREMGMRSMRQHASPGEIMDMAQYRGD